MKKTIIIILLGFLAVNSAFSQEENYTISDIVYDIKGSTKPFFLEQRLEYGIGDKFATLEDVEIFRKYLSQELDNLRTFESFSVTTDITGSAVVLNIYLDDAWGIIPFGYPKYDSEDGGRVAMKLFWYNSMGTLTNSLFQAGVNIGQNALTDELELQTWDAQFSIDDILLWGRFYNVSFMQSTERESKDDDEWSYYQTKSSIGTSFDIFGEYSYSPSISLTAKYFYDDVDGSAKEYDLDNNSLTLSYSHGIGESNINWNGNFRDGYSFGLSNTLSLEFGDNDDINPNATFTLYGTYLKSFGDLPISLGTKATAIVSIDDEMLGLGSKIRGVSSGDVYGNIGIFSSNNLFISVIRIVNFAEAIFGPHFDIGITDNSELKYGAGGDFILYVNKLKSLVARGSISTDLTTFDPTNFSLDDFAIDITSSLFF